jgi:hypothetical protein
MKSMMCCTVVLSRTMRVPDSRRENQKLVDHLGKPVRFIVNDSELALVLFVPCHILFKQGGGETFDRVSGCVARGDNGKEACLEPVTRSAAVRAAASAS